MPSYSILNDHVTLAPKMLSPHPMIPATGNPWNMLMKAPSAMIPNMTENPVSMITLRQSRTAMMMSIVF